MKVIKIILGIVLYIGAVYFSMEVCENFQYTQILLDHPVTGADVKRIQKQEREKEAPLGFCFWSQGEIQFVFCQETGGMTAVTPVLLAGNPGLMSAHQLAWQNGCLVDRETARELFGTASVGRQALWYQGKSYPVLGITEAARPTVILMAEEETELDRIVVPIPPQSGSVEGKQCLLRWGLSGKVLDFTLTWSLIQNALLIFPFLLFTMICTYFGNGWRDITWEGMLYGGQRRLLGKAVLWAVLFLGGMWVLGSQITIPQSMIPTKWSDFSFWPRWWASEKENAIAIAFAPMGNSQLQMAGNMVKSVITNIFACLVLLWPVRR